MIPLSHTRRVLRRGLPPGRAALNGFAAGLLLIGGGVPRPATAESRPNAVTTAEARTGWRVLFDGQSLKGFRTYREPVAGTGWQVKDGAIVRSAAGAGDLLTEEQFDSFELQLEYRIARGGDSGVLFHVTEEADAPWMTGPEVQILDDDAGRDPQKTGWLYQLYRPTKPDWVTSSERERLGDTAANAAVRATRPGGSWNHIHLRVAPESGEVVVNGVTYFMFKKGDTEWDARVAKSPFAGLPRFGKAGRGHICFLDSGDRVEFRSIKIRELPPAAESPGRDRVLPVRAAAAFPGIVWDGWTAERDDGRPAVPLRPLCVTHAGDGTGRRFVLDQGGMIHVLPADDGRFIDRARLFLDLRSVVADWRQANEEGLLGLAFHPRFGQTGEFFVCYSAKGDRRTQRISRFRVSKADPDRADEGSEEVLLSFEQPYANHNGGSIIFGPGGHLCLGLGDGGLRNDPDGNGQNLGTWLGSILRIDVDRREHGRPYGIPIDNPFREAPVREANFAAQETGPRPEIYAYGFRNPWQISFDPPTGRLFAADVGQELWEEINLVRAGGNYGWSLREGSKAFGPVDAEAVTIDPVFEYDHRVGKSVTGGFVYRGSDLPTLEGRYLYGDFVSGGLWALSLDDEGQAGENAVIPWNGLPIFGFGQDEAGEAYVLTSSATGQGVFKLVAATDRPIPTSKNARR